MPHELTPTQISPITIWDNVDLKDDLGFTDAELQQASGEDLEDLLEIRLAAAKTPEPECDQARSKLAVVLLKRYYAEDHGDDDSGEKRTRYITIDTIVATNANLRQASRRPDILRGVATNKFGILAAAPGTGKSMLALMMCASVASGRSILGFDPSDENGQNALFVSLEEDSSEILLRWQAMNQVYDVDTADRLHIAGENNIKFHNAGGIVEFVTSGIFDLVDLINSTRAKFVILDPLSQWRLGAEDNATFSLFSSAIKQVCHSCDTTIMAIHHVRKPPAGFQSESHNPDAIRGASDLRGAARTILLLDHETKIGDGVISLSFDKVQYGKSKYKLPPMTITQEIVETDQGNYATGVLVEYVPVHEQPMPAHIVDEYRNILIDMFDQEPDYRADVRSPLWIGLVIAERRDIDVGALRKSAERTQDQHTAIHNMKSDLAKLVRMDYITPSVKDVLGTNRQRKQVNVYTRGWKLCK